jgi:hypothetical protein
VDALGRLAGFGRGGGCHRANLVPGRLAGLAVFGRVTARNCQLLLAGVFQLGRRVGVGLYEAIARAASSLSMSNRSYFIGLQASIWEYRHLCSKVLESSSDG